MIRKKVPPGSCRQVIADLRTNPREAIHKKTYVYRYDGTTWVEEQILRAGDAQQWATFGSSVALNGDFAMIVDFWVCQTSIPLMHIRRELWG